MDCGGKLSSCSTGLRAKKSLMFIKCGMHSHSKLRRVIFGLPGVVAAVDLHLVAAKQHAGAAGAQAAGAPVAAAG